MQLIYKEGDLLEVVGATTDAEGRSCPFWFRYKETTTSQTSACVLLLVTSSAQLRSGIQTQLTSLIPTQHSADRLHSSAVDPRRAKAHSVKAHGWGRH